MSISLKTLRQNRLELSAVAKTGLASDLIAGDIDFPSNYISANNFVAGTNGITSIGNIYSDNDVTTGVGYSLNTVGVGLNSLGGTVASLATIAYTGNFDDATGGTIQPYWVASSGFGSSLSDDLTYINNTASDAQSTANTALSDVAVGHSEFLNFSSSFSTTAEISGSLYVIGSIRGLTAIDTRPVRVIVQGDSLSATSHNPYSYTLQRTQYFGSASFYNIATGGDTAENMRRDYSSEIGSLNNTGSAVWLFLLAGTNDLPTTSSASTIYNNIEYIWSTAKSSGIKVVGMTIPPSVVYTGPQETKRLAVNNAIRAGVANGVCDYVVEVDRIWPNTTTDMIDGLHPTEAAAKRLGMHMSTLGGYQQTPVEDRQLTNNVPLLNAVSNSFTGTQYFPNVNTYIGDTTGGRTIQMNIDGPNKNQYIYGSGANLNSGSGRWGISYSGWDGVPFSSNRVGLDFLVYGHQYDSGSALFADSARLGFIGKKLVLGGVVFADPTEIWVCPDGYNPAIKVNTDNSVVTLGDITTNAYTVNTIGAKLNASSASFSSRITALSGSGGGSVNTVATDFGLSSALGVFSASYGMFTYGGKVGPISFDYVDSYIQVTEGGISVFDSIGSQRSSYINEDGSGALSTDLITFTTGGHLSVASFQINGGEGTPAEINNDGSAQFAHGQFTIGNDGRVDYASGATYIDASGIINSDPGINIFGETFVDTDRNTNVLSLSVNGAASIDSTGVLLAQSATFDNTGGSAVTIIDGNVSAPNNIEGVGGGYFGLIVSNSTIASDNGYLFTDGGGHLTLFSLAADLDVTCFNNSPYDPVGPHRLSLAYQGAADTTNPGWGRITYGGDGFMYMANPLSGQQYKWAVELI